MRFFEGRGYLFLLWWEYFVVDKVALGQVFSE
jgi:hypothetical protein